MTPPVAEKKNKALNHLGETRMDEYYWLNDIANPAVMDYLKSENEYTQVALKDVSSLREELFREITGRIRKDDASVPYLLRGYYYYYRFEEKKEYPIYCRKKDEPDAREEILLDVNHLAKGHSYCHVAGIDISPDNRYMAYGLDTYSRRLYTLYIRDLSSGTMLEEAIPNTSGTAAWANDNRTLFYTLKNPETLREEKIMRHRTGTLPYSDHTVFVEEDETFHCEVYKTKSENYILIASASTLSDEYRYLDADHPDESFTVFQNRERGLEYSIEHYNDRFFIRTNLEATNFRLMETRVGSTGKENWKEVIAHRKDVLLDAFEIFKDYLAVAERKDATRNLRIIQWTDRSEYYIHFDEKTYTVELAYNPDFKSRLLRIRYSSLTTPDSVYDYDMKDRVLHLKKRQEILGGFDPSRYHSERLFASASDGTRVPVSIVYKAGLKRDGQNHVLLYGYGSYGISIDPDFHSARLSLLDRGFVYAIAHIRGGEEMGRPWYEGGKLLHKKNTFTDFIACAEHLIQMQYTNPAKLFAIGGSAGGLLMGVAANMRPDLFKGIIAAVPFVDVLTTMLDEQIPLTTGEYDEWGNPKDIIYYDYIKSYSPYDNIKAQNYPNMLVLTGLHDSQVQYWEPAKWVARLRAMKTDDNLLLLFTNFNAGHGGASGRFERYRETALEYAFLLKMAGIANRDSH